MPLIAKEYEGLQYFALADGLALDANAVVETESLYLSRVQGFFSVQISTAGLGKVTVTPLLSNNGTVYVASSRVPAVVQDFSGDVIEELSLPFPVRNLKFRIEETSGHPVTVSLWVVAQ